MSGPNLMAPQEQTGLAADAAAPLSDHRASQSYGGLVWQRFRKRRSGVIGAVFVLILILTSVFADFLSPYDPGARDRDNIYIPPQSLYFSASDGFSPIPATHPVVVTLDMTTWEQSFKEDTNISCRPVLFGQGWEYRLFGFKTSRHLLAATKECPWHILGTDRDGRDMLSRLIVGSQLTLIMAGLVVTIAIVVGTLVGIVSGYLGGRIDEWIQRVTELTLALPELPFYFALTAIVPRNMDPIKLFFLLGCILAALKWAQLAREVRGKTLSIGRLDYVVAAEAVGARSPRIVLKHILPNVMSHVVVITTLMVPQVILLESFLSFVGLGVQPPLVSWGLLLNAGKDLQNLGSYPWVLSPVFAILIAVLGFNMLGDGLRDSIDPYAD